jgi:hypothetical protein
MLTEKQAYAAMFHYLEKSWERTKSDAVGAMLGNLSLLPDGLPADAAVAADWSEAVDFATRGGSAGHFEIIHSTTQQA